MTSARHIIKLFCCHPQLGQLFRTLYIFGIRIIKSKSRAADIIKLFPEYCLARTAAKICRSCIPPCYWSCTSQSPHHLNTRDSLADCRPLQTGKQRLCVSPRSSSRYPPVRCCTNKRNSILCSIYHCAGSYQRIAHSPRRGWVSASLSQYSFPLLHHKAPLDAKSVHKLQPKLGV